MFEFSNKSINENILFTEETLSFLDKLKQNDEFNSARIYLDHLKRLFEHEEFCKSEKWVSYLKEQIEIMYYLLDDARYDPNDAENIKSKYIVDDRLSESRKNGGKATSRLYRETEKEIILRAKHILEKPHDSRPKNFYRTSSLADAITSTNGNKAREYSILLLPARTSVIKYLKNAVLRGELPDFLTGGNPGKW